MDNEVYTAIIDTGSSTLSVPPAVFDKLKEHWANDVETLDCNPKRTFCLAKESCYSVLKKIKPV